MILTSYQEHNHLLFTNAHFSWMGNWYFIWNISARELNGFHFCLILPACMPSIRIHSSATTSKFGCSVVSVYPENLGRSKYYFFSYMPLLPVTRRIESSNKFYVHVCMCMQWFTFLKYWHPYSDTGVRLPKTPLIIKGRGTSQNSHNVSTVYDVWLEDWTGHNGVQTPGTQFQNTSAKIRIFDNISCIS